MINKKLTKLSKEIIENSEILVYSDNMKSSKELLSLQKYHIKNQEQRFWQGLVNWAGFNIYKGVTNKNKTSLSGTPTNFQKLIIRIKDNGTAQAITWGDSFEAKGVALPTTTVISDEVAIVRFDGISEYPKRINRR